jgi:hypothetical protein
LKTLLIAATILTLYLARRRPSQPPFQQTLATSFSCLIQTSYASTHCSKWSIITSNIRKRRLWLWHRLRIHRSMEWFS